MIIVLREVLPYWRCLRGIRLSGVLGLRWVRTQVPVWLVRGHDRPRRVRT